MKYTNAPFLEMVVKLEWDKGFDLNRREEFFTTFSAIVSAENFVVSERLIPANVLESSGHPVFRFKRLGGGADSFWIHLGASCVFMNAMRPYSSWSDVKPLVEMVVNVTFKAFRLLGFDVSVVPSIKYVDSFDAKFFDNLSTMDFIKKRLGFDFKLPAAIDSRRDASGWLSAIMQFKVKLGADMVLETSVGDGRLGDAKDDVVLLETDITVLSSKTGTVDVVDSISKMQLIAHDVFVEISKPFEEIMK